jgi:hypothetical protein
LPSACWQRKRQGARARMMEGVNVLANAVKVTLGPKGGIDHHFAQDRAQRWAIGLKEVGRFLELSYPWRCKLNG